MGKLWGNGIKDKNTSVRHRETKMSNMLRYHGEMERHLFSAEIGCDIEEHKYDSKNCGDCPFKYRITNITGFKPPSMTCYKCSLPRIRQLLGIGDNL
jgi:hypothetical protein